MSKDSTLRLRTPQSSATTYLSSSRRLAAASAPRIPTMSRMVAWSGILAAIGGVGTTGAIVLEASKGHPVVSVHTVRVLVTLAAVGLVGILVGIARDTLLATLRDVRGNHDRMVEHYREMHDRNSARISDLADTVSVMAEVLDNLKVHIAELMDIREADIEMATLRQFTGNHYMVVPRPRDQDDTGNGNGNGGRGGQSGGRGRLRSVD